MGLKGFQQDLSGSLGFLVTASVGDEEIGGAAQEIYQVALLWFGFYGLTMVENTAL